MILQETDSFVLFKNNSGLVYEDLDNKYPTSLYGHNEEQQFFNNEKSSYFGFISSGECFIEVMIRNEFIVYKLLEGMYFSINKPFTMSGGVGYVVERKEQNSFFNIGGPIDAKGRLKYIDGCSDSLLISPVKRGYAILNHLHFPKNITQTMHTHPSIRAGLVYKGNGVCVTPYGKLPLDAGNLFIIKPNYKGEKSIGNDGQLYYQGSHKFDTTTNTMDVIAYHPETDFGCTDEDHPMLNFSIVDGVSAKNIEKIRTKSI